MGEQQHVAVDVGGEAVLDAAVGTPPDVIDGLALGPRAGPDTPVGDLGADVLGGPTLELAVIPLAQVRIDDRVREAGQVGGLGGPGSRTGEHEGEMVSGQPRTQGHGLAAALLGQGNVAAAGVPSGLRPLGLPVADEPDLTFRRGDAHRVASGRTVSSAVAAKNSRGVHPKAHASGRVGRVEILVLYR